MGIGAWAQQGGKPVGGIDIIIKKQPSGSATLVRTDANGGFSVRIPEAGIYSLRFAAPPDLPGLPGTVRSSIKFIGDATAAALSSIKKPTQRSLLKGWDFKSGAKQSVAVVNASGLYSFEELDFSGPGVFSGSLTADRSLTSLEALSYVAVEGQLSPLPQSIEILAEGYSTFEYSAELRPGLERRWRTLLEPASGAWRGTGPKPDLRVTLNTSGLPEGTYSDEVILTLRSGEQTEQVRLPIAIHIRPRGFDLGILTDRTTYVITQRTGTVRNIIRVSNPTNVEQTYTLEPAADSDRTALTLPAGSIRVPSGQTVEVPVQVDAAALRTRHIPIRMRTAGSAPKVINLIPAPGPTDSAPCVATDLVPILINRPNNVLRAVPVNFEFEVYNNCGTQLTDVTVQARGTVFGTSKSGIKTLTLTSPDSGPDQLQVEVRAGELTGETAVDLQVENTPVPAMKAINKGSIASGRDRPTGLATGQIANSQSIAPGAIVEAETTPGSQASELLLNGRPVSILNRRGDVFTFRVPYNTDPTLTHLLQIRDGNHTSAAFPLPLAPAAPVILRNAETGAYTFLRNADGSLTPVTSETRAPAGSTLVLFAEGLGSVEQEPTAEAPTLILSSANRKLKAGINDGIGSVSVGLGKWPPTTKLTPTEIALTSDLPIKLEGSPEVAFRLTFTLPEGLESADPAAGLVALSVESLGVASELGPWTHTIDPALFTSVNVTSRAVPFPAVHLWDNVSQSAPRAASEPVGQARTLEGPTPQLLGFGIRLRLADMVSNLATNSTQPNGNTWDIVVPNSASPVDYTAIYEKDFQLTLQVSPPACGTLSTGALASPGNWWPEGSTVPLTRTINPGWTVLSILGGTSSTATLMDRPRTVIMTCQQGFPVTLRVDPLAPVTVRINNVSSPTGTVTSTSNGPVSLTVPNDFIQGPNYYFFTGTSTPSVSWSQQSSSGTWSATAPAPTAAITYFANFNFGCIVLTPAPNMTLSGGTPFTRPGAPANCFTFGSTVTITATAPAGQCFDSWSDGRRDNPRTWFVVNNPFVSPRFGPCAPASTCVSAPAGPGGWWSFETASGPVLDRMPLALNGIRRGNPTPIQGKVGNALQFDGASSVEVPYNAIFDTPISAGPQGNFTMDAWVRIDPTLSAPGGQLAGVRRLPGLSQVWAWGVGKSGLGLYAENVVAANGYENWGSSGLSITDNNWHFVALRLERDPATGFANLTFWLDGAKYTRSTNTKVNDLSASGRSFFIGSSGYTGAPGQNFVGGVDEFEYFQRALTDAEIEGIYQAGDKGKCPPTPSTDVRITVNTNPANVNATVGTTAFGSASPSFSTVLPAGTTALAVTAQSPVTNVAAGIRYELQTTNTWSVNGTPNPNYSTSPQPVPVPTVDTTYTANYRTLFEVKVVINGTCTVQPTPGFYPSGLQLPVTITPATGATATWAFTGGSLSVVSGGRIPVLSPGTLTVNCTSNTTQPVLVNTNPANIGARVGIAGQDNPDTYSTTLPVNSNQTLTAQDPVVSAGTVYRFDSWSPNGPNVTIPPSGTATYTANYRIAGYVVTITGCASTVGPTSLAILTNPLAFPTNANLNLTANPPAGQTFTNFAITMGGSTTTRTTNPTSLTLTGPATIVATCGAPNTVPLTVVTNPASLPVVLTVGGITPGSGFGNNGLYQANAVPSAAGTVTAFPVQVFNSTNTTRWDFKNWSGPGIVAPGTSPNLQAFAVQPTATNLVANYDTFYKVDVVNNGCASVVPVPGFYPAGSTLTVTVTPGNNNQLGSLNFGTPQGGATLAPINNNSTVTIDAYKVVEATCGATPTGAVSVTANPPDAGATVGVGAGSAPNNFTAFGLPAGPVTLTATPGPFVNAQGLRYELQRWRQGNTLLGNAGTQAGTVVAGVTTAYIVDYRLTGIRVTLINNGCTSVGTTPALPADGILTPNSAITALTATLPPGGAFTNAVITYTAIPSGQTFSTTTTSLSLNPPITVNTPVAITFNCAAATTVGVTVNTNPAALGATVGIGAASGVNTVTANLPAGSAQTLSAPTTALVTSTGLGYRLNNWTPAGPAVTLPATGSVTYTANYAVACSLILTEVNPAGTGTITLSPASPANLPTNCYPNGTAITATLTPAAGRIATGFQPHTGGSGQSGPGAYTFILIGPTLLTGTTTVAPAPAPNVNWAFVSRTGLTAVFRVTNNGNLPATNLRITALTPSLGLRYSNQPPLPLAVGTIAPGASATVTLAFQDLGESLEPNPNLAFSVGLTSQADNLPAAVSTIQVPAPPPTTVRLEAVSRTNTGNTGTLVFRITNTGANPTIGLNVGLQITGATGLTFPNTNFQVIPAQAPGASQQVTFQIALPAGQNMAAATLTANLQVGGNVPATSARWRFDPPTTIVPLP